VPLDLAAEDEMPAANDEEIGVLDAGHHQHEEILSDDVDDGAGVTDEPPSSRSRPAELSDGQPIYLPCSNNNLFFM